MRQELGGLPMFEGIEAKVEDIKDFEQDIFYLMEPQIP